MSKFSDISGPALERALELASQAGESLKHGGSNAADWLKAGAAIGAMKTGGRAVGRVVRRMTAAVGLPTLRLVRASMGEHVLEGLLPGQWREVWG